MTELALDNYVCGRWVTGEGAATLVNPATEAPLATAATGGLDLAAAMAFARGRGRESVGALTFRERGEVLRAMSRAVHGRRDELLALAIANGGNTRADAKFDVDGAIATLTAYADLGGEIGDRRTLADGDAVQLGRSARLFGRHVHVPRAGVAVHVNAFNFPAWGLAEKAACALLAGMPVLAKPATSTALLAHRIVQIWVEGRVAPEGALSLLCGPAGDLLDHLGGDDVLAFTGSGATAASVRSRPAFSHASAHVNVEADSLNAAVLGPDVAEGSDLGLAFVADVVRDVTQKAGQKCTAIRRVYVPSSVLEGFVERLADRLREVRVGDPARDDVGMGPLATAAQLRDVRAGIAALARAARVVCGGAGAIDGLGVAAGKGYFVAPTLLVAGEGRVGAGQDPEVFGPVATVTPYDGDASAAARLINGGGGGLVASIYSDDKDFVRSVVLGIAPHHGRICITSSKTASQAIPPGTVMPQLLHGGPGRAGGGEELGGRRGVLLYMQRVALQGDRATIEEIASR
ncbi:MAG TPA: 3,4-dehydroadipyl-CoA semialdehyde dehydrogenase [Polyangiaceae bacterium]|jgi:oxepin-CoA hydrolase/3-oxo-5,6-dehydrosuberyl-CoA semialdehyde dehydrogenase